MNTTRALCAEALQRANLAPEPSTLTRILAFADTVDHRLAGVDPLDRTAIENAAVEYALCWALAEQLETVCGQAGPITGAGRANPALTQAATCRARMRQIVKALKTDLKSAQPPRREDDAPAEPRHPQQPSPAPTHPRRRTGEAAAEPPQAAIHDVDIAEPSTPTPETPNPIPELNRAQRRAQARLEARRHRKAQKRARHALEHAARHPAEP